MQNGLRSRLSFLLAAGGVGLCAYAGQEWYKLPHYSEDDLQASTELNLQMDLGRRDLKTLPTQEQMEQLRRRERSEIDQEIHTAHDDVLTWFAVGLALLVMAGGQFLFAWLLR